MSLNIESADPNALNKINCTTSVASLIKHTGNGISANVVGVSILNNSLDCLKALLDYCRKMKMKIFPYGIQDLQHPKKMKKFKRFFFSRKRKF